MSAKRCECGNPCAVQDHRYRTVAGTVTTYRKTLPWCWACKSRLLKERHPETYVLNALRNRARKRKLPFEITLAEFRKWCAETGYLERRGRDEHSFSIGRKDHSHGYSIDNIECEPYLDNCRKGHTVEEPF